MRLDKYAKRAGTAAAPQLTLTEFARRIGMPADRLHAIFAASRSHPLPTGKANNTSAVYALSALQAWWQARLGQPAKETNGLRQLHALDAAEPAEGQGPKPRRRGVRAASEVAVHAAARVLPEVPAGNAGDPLGQAAAAVSVVVPLRTGSGLNERLHHHARARKVKNERSTVGWSLRNSVPPALPCTVVLTRLGPSNGLDGDNLQGGLKGVRDEVALWLGVDDRDPRVQWKYEQRRVEAWAVSIEVTPA